MVTLEQIFLSPYFWRPPKVCEFLKRTLKLLKDRKGEVEVKEFTDKLDNDSALPQNCAWPCADNWKDVLDKFKVNKDKTLFDICITRYEGKKLRRGKYNDEDLRKISFLLKIIRDNYEYSGDLPVEDKKELGWFTETGNLSNALFVQFWANLFPRLVPFLWKKFKQFSDCPTLQEYYLFPFNTVDVDQLPIDLEGVLEQLNSAKFDNLRLGGLAARYSSNSSLEGPVVEFRNLSVGGVNGVLQGCSLMKMEVLSDSATWKWYEISGGFSQQRHEIKLNFGNGQVGENFPACLVVGNNVSELVAQASAQLKNEMNVGSGHSRVVAFTSFDEDSEANQLGVIDKLLDNIPGFVETPVQWSELSEEVRQRIENHGLLSFQNTKVKIIEALEIDDVVRSKIFSDLNGPMLTRFLRGIEVKLFEKICIPAVLNNYKSRVLFDRSSLSSMIFQEDLESGEILLVANITLAELQPLVKNSEDRIRACNDDNISILSNLSYEIYLLETEIFTRREFEKYFPAFKNVPGNIHCIRYLKESKRFGWVATKGSLFGVKDLFSRAAKDGHDVMMKEVEVIEALEKGSENMLVIADKPGMGKTQVLVKLANALVSTATNKLVVFVSFHDFMKSIRPTFNSPEEIFDPVKVDVVLVLNYLVSLVCQNSFEENLLRYWLTMKQSKVKIELLLDGLDELLIGERDYAFKILNVLRDDLFSIRVWVTVTLVSQSDHMLDKIRSNFCTLGYKFEPFTAEEQIDFLEQHWTEYVERRNIVNKNVNSENLRSFARKCMKVPLSADETEIAGIPLQCRMIAEINEQKVVDGDLSIDPTVSLTLIGLYEQLLERKFVVYLTEKKKLSEIGMNENVVQVLRSYAESMHIYFALKLIFDEDKANYFLHKILSKANCKEQISASVLEHGVVQSLNPITFVHRTFAEFIIAQFVSRVLKGEFLNIDRADSNFERFLWNDVLDVDSYGDGVRTRYASSKLPTVCYFLNAMLEEATPVICELESLFAKLWDVDNDARFRLGCANSVPVLVASLETRQNNLLALLFKSKKCGPKQWHILQNFEGKHFSILHWCAIGWCEHCISDSCDSVPLRTTPEFLKYVVAKDPNLVEQQDANERTPLLLFVWYIFNKCIINVWQRRKIVWFSRKLVSDLHANIFATDNEGKNALHYLCNAILQFKSPQHSLWLECLSVFSQRQSLKQLLNSADKDGLTPFLIALKYIHDAETGYLKCFVEAGADLNCRDKHGNTPLHISVENRYKNDFIRELIEFGADIFAKNSKGKSALHLAVEQKNLPLVNILYNLQPVLLQNTDNEERSVVDYETSEDIREFLLIPNSLPWKSAN